MNDNNPCQVRIDAWLKAIDDLTECTLLVQKMQQLHKREPEEIIRTKGFIGAWAYEDKRAVEANKKLDNAKLVLDATYERMVDCCRKNRIDTFDLIGE